MLNAVAPVASVAVMVRLSGPLPPGRSPTCQTGAGEALVGGAFQFQRPDIPLPAGQTITTTFDTVGVYILTLNVMDHGRVGSDSINVTVLPNFDRDGMPDDWELAHKLNPLDPTDAYVNPDADGLKNLQEYHLGTNPRKADTVGDTATDGAEVTAGTDPLRADQAPANTPVLLVGSNDLQYDLQTGDPAPAPETFWVSNAGTGTIDWTASSDAAWLHATPPGDSAPAQVTLSLDPSGLSIGLSTGHVTVRASGAAGSPHTLTVEMHIWRRGDLPELYLPILRK